MDEPGEDETSFNNQKYTGGSWAAQEGKRRAVARFWWGVDSMTTTTAAKKTKAKIAIITKGTSMMQTISIPLEVMIQMITAIATTIMPG